MMKSKIFFKAKDVPAVIHGNQTVSYTQLIDASKKCAKQLQKAGIKEGDRVGILDANTLDYIIVLLGLWSSKAIACPLSTRLPENTLVNQLQEISVRNVITSQKKPLASGRLKINQLAFSKLVDTATLSTNTKEKQSLNYNRDQDATIIFTSGSSAQPKAALHTLDNHIYNASGSNKLIPIQEGDSWLLSLPLYHVGGLGILFRTLKAGGTLVIPNPNENIVKAVKKYSLTHISLVFTQLRQLMADKQCCLKLKNYKAILTGGSTIPEQLLEASRRLKLPVYTTYGMTESASQIATGKYPSGAQLLSHRKVKISKDGEILIKGKVLFKGYIKGKDINLPLDPDGWFATGDLGCLSDKGQLTVTGRKDNMFISGGENIQPEEIEHCLCRLEPIEEAVVVPQQNDEFGYRPIAFVRISRNCVLKQKSLLDFLKGRLPKYKIPDRFFILPNKPETGALKIDRLHLSQMITKNSLTFTQIN